VQTQYCGTIQRKNAESASIHPSAKVGSLMDESKIIGVGSSGGGSSTVILIHESAVGVSLSRAGKCEINS
jgi:hypothetical protein